MSLFSPANNYLLRIPAKPINGVLDFHQFVDSEEFGGYLAKFFNNPQLKEAIYITSPELYTAMLNWLEGNLHDSKQEKKLLQSLHKYYTRMSSRSTPYGLFAGCAVGNITDSPTNIDFTESVIKKHARLDMNYVGEITNYFNRLPLIISQVKFFPNDTLYKIGDRYRYVEYTLKNRSRSYRLTSLADSVYLDIVLEAAQKGQKLEFIKEKLVQAKIEPAQADTYLLKLIEAQVLVSDLYLTATGDEYFDVLLKQLKTLKGTEAYTMQLELVKTILMQQDDSIEKYIELKKNVQGFVPTDSKDLVQVDLFYEPKTNSINKHVIQEMISTCESMYKIGSVIKSSSLEEFKKKFVAQYEESEVSLFQALDLEVGIGYGINIIGNTDNVPLLNELVFTGKSPEQNFKWNGESRKIYQKLKKFIEEKKAIIEITDDDLSEISTKNISTNQVPASAYLFCNLLANSEEELDKGNYQFSLSGFGGPSTGNLLGRFCHGDSKLSQLVTDCLAEEQEAFGDVILAEIVHLPEARIGNVLMRPNFRQYEIPILGKSSVPEEFQIQLRDLMVSVKNDKVILRSKRLNKEIIPRLTNAHNYVQGLPIYRFLCDLQSQGMTGMYFWNWSVFSEEIYLPRVQYKKLILQRARWNFKKKDFPELQNNTQDLIPVFKSLQAKYAIPRLVVIHEDDNELLINFSSNASIELLIQMLRKKDVLLLEYLSTPDKCFIRGNNGSYANEIIIPLKANIPKYQSPIVPQIQSKILSKRTFIVGSEWLYVKIYGGNKILDTMLTEVIKPLTEDLLEKNQINKWFFIRYTDPDGHLRIRFHHNTNADFWMIVLKKLHEKLQPYIDKGLISKVMTDTYHKEIERYGLATMDISEYFFLADSTAIVGFLDLIDGDEGETYRWLFALRNIDTLLDDFGYSIEQKFDLLIHLQASFYDEFNKDNKTNNLLYRLNTKYRTESKNIERILNPANDTEDFMLAVGYFKERSKQNATIASDIREVYHSNPQDAKSIDDLLPSYIHMTLNRTFLALPRKHELIIYHYLMKYYESMLARKRVNIKKGALSIN